MKGSIQVDGREHHLWQAADPLQCTNHGVSPGIQRFWRCPGHLKDWIVTFYYDQSSVIMSVEGNQMKADIHNFGSSMQHRFFHLDQQDIVVLVGKWREPKTSRFTPTRLKPGELLKWTQARVTISGAFQFASGRVHLASTMSRTSYDRCVPTSETNNRWTD